MGEKRIEQAKSVLGGKALIQQQAFGFSCPPGTGWPLNPVSCDRPRIIAGPGPVDIRKPVVFVIRPRAQYGNMGQDQHEIANIAEGRMSDCEHSFQECWLLANPAGPQNSCLFRPVATKKAPRGANKPISMTGSD